MCVDIDKLNKEPGKKVIKTIIRLKNDMIMVFDPNGDQAPRYYFVFNTLYRGERKEREK